MKNRISEAEQKAPARRAAAATGVLNIWHEPHGATGTVILYIIYTCTRPRVYSLYLLCGIYIYIIYIHR